MRSTLLLTALLLGSISSSAQTVTNGNFSGGTTGWGCTPEIGAENLYGGGGTNPVSEVDAGAGLCQTINGFTVGYTYNISFVASRRTNCGPATQTADLSIDGGALGPVSISRTGGFNLTGESFDFTATATSHVLDFTGTVVGTCGLILDDIVITLIATLPVELLSFNAQATDNNTVKLFWQTASETNNAYFTVERSFDGLHWDRLEVVEGKGNSSTLQDYLSFDHAPNTTLTSYYRLLQVDVDGHFSYSNVVAVNFKEPRKPLFYPNPTTGNLTITGDAHELQDITILNSRGQDVSPFVRFEEQDPDRKVVDLTTLDQGLFFIRTRTNVGKIYKR